MLSRRGGAARGAHPAAAARSGGRKEASRPRLGSRAPRTGSRLARTATQPAIRGARCGTCTVSDQITIHGRQIRLLYPAPAPDPSTNLIVKFSPPPRSAARSCPFFFFQAEDGIRDYKVTGVQTCALPI